MSLLARKQAKEFALQSSFCDSNLEKLGAPEHFFVKNFIALILAAVVRYIREEFNQTPYGPPIVR